MRIGHPLRDSTARARHDADENADNGATENQPEMPEGVFNAFHDAAAQVLRRPVAGNRSAANRQIDYLRNRKDTDEDRHEIQPVPEIHHAEIKPQRAGLAFLTDGRYEQSEQPHGEPLDLPARGGSAQGGDTRD